MNVGFIGLNERSSKLSEYIKSPINYIGNKYKLLPQIIPLFPKNIQCFVDLFGGSGTVLINTKAKKYIYNDINNYVAEIFEGLVSTKSADEIIKQVESVIKEYGINMTDKEPFEKLRSDYNNGKKDWVTLYALMCCSFNSQFRFNSKHEYNSSFGKSRSHFSDNQKSNLRKMKNAIGNNIQVLKRRFQDFNIYTLTDDDFVYCDPPYLNSTGNFNDGKRGFEGWSEQHEQDLLTMLDALNKRKVKFALSNDFKYDNPLLKEWAKSYNVHNIDCDYSNCNHQKIDRVSKDIEVLITNY